MDLPNFTLSKETLEALENQDNAKAFHKRLVSYIIEFEKKLSDSEEVGARLVSFGESISFHIDNIGYWNPSLICFYGTKEDGSKLQLIQNISQISVLLISMPRQKERERMGYKFKEE